MEGGDHQEEAPQAVVPSEITEKEPAQVEEKPEALTDSILDDDLVVIPSLSEIQQEPSSATEQPDTVVSSEPFPQPPSPAAEPEPQAATPVSEPAQPIITPQTQPIITEPPQPTVEPALSQPVPPPQPNPEPSIKIRPASSAVKTSKPTQSKAVEDDEDDDFEDETLVERLVGLSEMFPETLCTVAGVTFSLSVSGVKKLFNFSRSALWIGSTSFMILILPIVFETEMVHMEQAQIQRQKQILLGPNAATAGGMTGGMTPPIPGVSVAAPPSEGR